MTQYTDDVDYATSKEYEGHFAQFLPNLRWSHTSMVDQYAGRDLFRTEGDKKITSDAKLIKAETYNQFSRLHPETHLMIEVAHNKKERGWMMKDLGIDSILYGWEPVNYIYEIGWKGLNEWFFTKEAQRLCYYYGVFKTRPETNDNGKFTFNVRAYWNDMPSDIYNKIELL